MAKEGFLVPVIDLAKFEEEKEKLMAAVEEYGCFRVINHGIPERLMADMKASAAYFFNLPSQVKRRNTDVILRSGHVEPNHIAPLYEGLGIYDANSLADVHKFCSDLDASPRHRETLSTYASKLHALIVDLASKVAEGLGVMRCSFEEWHCHLRMNRYNFTEEALIGSTCGPIHTDNDFITVLHEDESVGGLEIMDFTGNFVSVDPVPGTFLVNVGDIAKVWSNGRLDNRKHRVVCKKARQRITVALFMLAPKDNKVEAQVELIDSEHPKLYRNFDYSEYRIIKFSSSSLTEEVLIHWAIDEAVVRASLI